MEIKELYELQDQAEKELIEFVKYKKQKYGTNVKINFVVPIYDCDGLNSHKIKEVSVDGNDNIILIDDEAYSYELRDCYAFTVFNLYEFMI
jgi:hypothetical protein